MKNIKHITTTVVFLIFIFVFALITVVKPKKEFSKNENRSLDQIPEFTMESLLKGDFAKDYETYLSDQFVFRDKWIAIKTLTEIAMLKKDINGVYLADDNYLIEVHNSEEIDEERVQINSDRMATFINKYAKILGENHVKAMVVPTAVMTLYEKLPAFATTYDQNNLIDYIDSKIENNNFVDVRNILLKHKNEYIYYKTDHHMTMLGTYYTYTKWAKDMGITPYKLSDFQIENSEKTFKGTIYSKINFAFEYDFVSMYKPKFDISYKVYYDTDSTEYDSVFATSHLKEKDMYQVYLDGNHAMVKVDTNVKNNRKLLIIKDSYAHSFATLAANHFETTYMIDFRYYKDSIGEFIEKNHITDILVLYNGINFATDTNTFLFER